MSVEKREVHLEHSPPPSFCSLIDIRYLNIAIFLSGFPWKINTNTAEGVSDVRFGWSDGPLTCSWCFTG